MNTQFVKEIVKTVCTGVNRHRKGDKKDILILSSARSGSTWLMQILYTQPGIKYINEPLYKNILDYHALLPLKTHWNYLSLAPFEEEVFMEYFSEDNKTRRFGPRNMFAGDYNFRTNRRVFKVIRANALIEWFAKELDFEIVYLIRHPIAQSLSCIERGHQCELAEYIEDVRFVEQYLDESLGNFIREILHTGSELTRFAAEWCLDNLVPLKKSGHEPSWLVLTYEELVLKYEETMGLLCDRLDLNHMERLFKRKTAPSFTTGRSGAQTWKKIINADSHYLVERWKQHVTEEMEKAVFEILDRFHIDAYRQGSVLPGKRLLHFKYPNGSLHV